MHTLPAPPDNPLEAARLPNLDAWTPARETPEFRAAVAAELARCGLHA